MSIICRVGNRQVKRTGFRVFSFLKETNDDALDSSRKFLVRSRRTKTRSTFVRVVRVRFVIQSDTIYHKHKRTKILPTD